MDLNAHSVTKTYFWETPLFVTEAPVPCRVNPGKYGQGGKYGHMTYNLHVQEHRSVTKECFISALNSIYSARLHPYIT